MKLKNLVMTLALGAMVMLSSVQTANAEEEKILRGVFIGGVDVSYMTKEQATQAVEAKLGKGTGGNYTVKINDTVLNATAEDFGMSWNNREVVDEALEVGKGGNVIKRYKDKKDLQAEPKNFAVEYAPVKEKVQAYVENIALQYNQEAVEGDISFANGYPEVTGGNDGIAVNVEQSVAAIMDALNGSGTELPIVAEITEPKLTREVLSMVKDVLGQATTSYNIYNYNRAANVENGAAKVSGTLLMPGETFSMVRTVTPFTEDNGYYPAPSYESGQVVDSLGGGICQVSTTLYNAVLKSELQIDERHNHSMTVSYVDPSKDAAIAEGLLDFVFTNNKEYPIYIYGYGYQGTLQFTIYGHENREAGRSLSFWSEVIRRDEPENNVKLVAKADENVGFLNKAQDEHIGLEARLWKTITYPNGSTENVQVNSSHYQTAPTIYEVGVVSPNPNVVAVINQAIAVNDLATVQAVINGAYGPINSVPQPETQAPETQAPETQAPETQAPPVEDPGTGDWDEPVGGGEGNGGGESTGGEGNGGGESTGGGEGTGEGEGAGEQIGMMGE